MFVVSVTRRLRPSLEVSSDAQAAVPCRKRAFDSRQRMLLYGPFDIQGVDAANGRLLCGLMAVTRSPPGSGAGSHVRLPAIAVAERMLAPWRHSMERWYRTVHWSLC